MVAVKIKDVAEKAQTSSATVSRVLAGKPHISEEMRARVLAAADALNYRPSRVARSLRLQRSASLGVIVSDIENPFFTSLVRAVEDAAYNRGFGTIVCNTDEDTQKEAFYLQLLRSEHVAGVVISPTGCCDDAIQALQEDHIPLVAVNRRISSVPVDTVSVDNVQAAYSVTRHLMDNGHRDIALVVGLPTSTTASERREGYVRALREEGARDRPELVHHVIPMEQPGFVAASQLLDLPNPPTAIVAGNGLLLVGAFRAGLARGLVVPDDYALAGFDDMRWASLIGPGLTVIEQPIYELGLAAASLIFERLGGSHEPPQTVVLKSRLIVRESSGPGRIRQPAPAA